MHLAQGVSVLGPERCELSLPHLHSLLLGRMGTPRQALLQLEHLVSWAMVRIAMVGMAMVSIVARPCWSSSTWHVWPWRLGAGARLRAGVGATHLGPQRATMLTTTSP